MRTCLKAEQCILSKAFWNWISVSVVSECKCMWWCREYLQSSVTPGNMKYWIMLNITWHFTLPHVLLLSPSQTNTWCLDTRLNSCFTKCSWSKNQKSKVHLGMLYNTIKVRQMGWNMNFDLLDWTFNLSVQSICSINIWKKCKIVIIGSIRIVHYMGDEVNELWVAQLQVHCKQDQRFHRCISAMPR